MASTASAAVTNDENLDKIIVVFGISNIQGRHVAQHLRNNGWTVVGVAQQNDDVAKSTWNTF